MPITKFLIMVRVSVDLNSFLVVISNGILLPYLKVCSDIQKSTFIKLVVTVIFWPNSLRISISFFWDLLVIQNYEIIILVEG